MPDKAELKLHSAILLAYRLLWQTQLEVALVLAVCGFREDGDSLIVEPWA